MIQEVIKQKTRVFLELNYLKGKMGPRDGKQKRLDNLPRNEDEFWEGANQIAIKPQLRDCKHFFHLNGQEAECKDCGAGFFLSKGWVVKKGHIYKGKKFVI